MQRGMAVAVATKARLVKVVKVVVVVVVVVQTYRFEHCTKLNFDDLAKERTEMEQMGTVVVVVVIVVVLGVWVKERGNNTTFDCI